MSHRIFIWTLPLAGALAVFACAGGVQPVDSKKFLNETEGPSVPTVQDELLSSAKKAETDGQFRQAAIFYQQALDKKPNDPDITFAYAEALRRSGEPDKAIALYDQLIAKDPKMLAAKESKGLALLSKGDFDTPTTLFEDVMKTDPTRWKTLNALGILFSTRNLQPEAQQYFNEALKYHPDSASIYNNLGLSQALGKQFDPAIASLQKASNIAQPNERKRIDLNLALVYATAGKLDEAKALAENYLTGPALDNNLGLYAHLAKDDQMARAYLNMALMESKTYYARAWDNLQDISTNGNDSSPAEHKRPKHKATNTAATAPAPTTKLPADLFPSGDISPSE